METQAMVKTVAYIRVSTDKQADHGVSLDAQRDKILTYANLYDLDLIDIVVDAGASAKSLEREGLQHALAMLHNGDASALLVTKLDRLTRRVRDLAALIEDFFQDGVFTLLSVCDNIDTRTASGRLVLNVLMSVAQWEREIISERTKESLSFKKVKGESLGRPTYGYVAIEGSTNYAEQLEEQRLIQTIRALRTQGMSQRAIVEAVTTQGFTTRKGTPLSLVQVQRIMKRHSIA
jgi:DNA invertase Pin-like site-specific DNA recombinase